MPSKHPLNVEEVSFRINHRDNSLMPLENTSDRAYLDLPLPSEWRKKLKGTRKA